LSVEEQFYLVWPLLLVWLLAIRGSRLWVVAAVVAGVVVPAWLRIVLWDQQRSWVESYFATHTRADGLFLGLPGGCAFALVPRPPPRVLRLALHGGAVVGLGALSWYAFAEGVLVNGHMSLGGDVVVSAASALVIVALVSRPVRWLSWPFEANPSVGWVTFPTALICGITR